MTTAPAVSEALKPCPFCGSAAYKTRFDDRTHIQCVNDDDCHACADVQRFDEADAIAIWNTRASTPTAGLGEPTYIDAVEQAFDNEPLSDDMRKVVDESSRIFRDHLAAAAPPVAPPSVNSGDVMKILANEANRRFGSEMTSARRDAFVEGGKYALSQSPATSGSERDSIQKAVIDTEQSGHGLSLLPCPFCGGRPHQGLMKAERCQLHGEEFQMYRVWCSHGCAQKIGASKDIAYKEWNTRANAETNTRKVSESTPPAGFADPIPATSGAMPSVEDVARLVDPVTYGKYDRLKADGTKAANGQPWCDVVHGRVIEYALERARAILALFPTDSVQQRPQNESSRVADGQATKSGGVE